MIYSRRCRKNVYTVRKGANHGPAAIPEEGNG